MRFPSPSRLREGRTLERPGRARTGPEARLSQRRVKSQLFKHHSYTDPSVSCFARVSKRTNKSMTFSTATLSKRARQRRRAFSLLEMLLAIAILGTSLAILAQIADTGVSAAREARALATARMICQYKLSEELLNIASGQTPTSVVETLVESYDTESTESYYATIEVMPGQLDGTLAMRVTVEARGGDGTQRLAIYALDRWVVDPALGLEEAEAEELMAREEIANGGTAL